MAFLSKNADTNAYRLGDGTVKSLLDAKNATYNNGFDDNSGSGLTTTYGYWDEVVTTISAVGRLFEASTFYQGNIFLANDGIGAEYEFERYAIPFLSEYRGKLENIENVSLSPTLSNGTIDYADSLVTGDRLPKFLNDRSMVRYQRQDDTGLPTDEKVAFAIKDIAGNTIKVIFPFSFTEYSPGPTYEVDANYRTQVRATGEGMFAATVMWEVTGSNPVERYNQVWFFNYDGELLHVLDDPIAVASGESSVTYGQEVKIGAGIIAIADPETGGGEGRVYIYDLNFTLLHELQCSSDNSGDLFGSSMDIGYDQLAIGAPGRSRVDLYKIEDIIETPKLVIATDFPYRIIRTPTGFTNPGSVGSRVYFADARLFIHSTNGGLIFTTNLFGIKFTDTILVGSAFGEKSNSGYGYTMYGDLTIDTDPPDTPNALYRRFSLFVADWTAPPTNFGIMDMDRSYNLDYSRKRTHGQGSPAPDAVQTFNITGTNCDFGIKLNTDGTMQLYDGTQGGYRDYGRWLDTDPNGQWHGVGDSISANNIPFTILSAETPPFGALDHPLNTTPYEIRFQPTSGSNTVSVTLGFSKDFDPAGGDGSPNAVNQTPISVGGRIGGLKLVINYTIAAVSETVSYNGDFAFSATTYGALRFNTDGTQNYINMTGGSQRWCSVDPTQNYWIRCDVSSGETPAASTNDDYGVWHPLSGTGEATRKWGYDTIGGNGNQGTATLRVRIASDSLGITVLDDENFILEWEEGYIY